MSTFVDIGAHNGMTVEAALECGFDRVYAFEPMPREFAALTAAYGNDPRVQLHNFGLSNATGSRTMYGSNDNHAASIHRTAWQVDPDATTECKFVDAGEWFRDHAPQGVVVKINCEGSECDIFDSLIDAGQMDKIRTVVICFDVRLVPGLAYREDEIRARFAEIGFDRWHLFGAFKGATHKDRIREWLAA